MPEYKCICDNIESRFIGLYTEGIILVGFKTKKHVLARCLCCGRRFFIKRHFEQFFDAAQKTLPIFV